MIRKHVVSALIGIPIGLIIAFGYLAALDLVSCR